jgi:uncharacterized protein
MTEFALVGIHGIRNRLKQINSIWTLVLAIPLGVYLLDPNKLPGVLNIAVTALGGTLPYIVVAVFLIAYLKASGAESTIARAFEGRETKMIVFAALFGGLAPFCSCEVIPFISALLAVGTPLSAVMAFWLSSPLIDPPTLFITAAALGWKFAVGKAVAAVSLGLIGGFAIRALIHNGAFSEPLRPRPAGGCCSCASSPFKGKPQWKFWAESERREVFRLEGISNAKFLLKWLTLAYLLEALLILYVPAQVIGSVVGGEGVWPIVVSALVGAPAYLNSYVAPALVAGLMEQGMSAGAAMAFMIAGSVSSIPAMAAVWSLVNRPVFAAYMGLGIGGAVIIGIVFAALI